MNSSAYMRVSTIAYIGLYYSHRFIIPIYNPQLMGDRTNACFYVYAYSNRSLSPSASGCINPSLGSRGQSHEFSFSICLCQQHPLYWDDHTLQLSLSSWYSHHLLFAAHTHTIAVLLPAVSCLWYKRLQLLDEYLHSFPVSQWDPKYPPQYSHLRSLGIPILSVWATMLQFQILSQVLSLFADFSFDSNWHFPITYNTRQFLPLLPGCLDSVLHIFITSTLSIYCWSEILDSLDLFQHVTLLSVIATDSSSLEHTMISVLLVFILRCLLSKAPCHPEKWVWTLNAEFSATIRSSACSMSQGIPHSWYSLSSEI